MRFDNLALDAANRRYGAIYLRQPADETDRNARLRRRKPRAIGYIGIANWGTVGARPRLKCGTLARAHAVLCDVFPLTNKQTNRLCVDVARRPDP